MKKLKCFRYEFCLFLLITFLLVIWTVDISAQRSLSFRLIATLVDGVEIIVTLRKLYLEKWRVLMIRVAQKMFSSVAKLFLHWVEVWNISKKKNVIMGETKIQFLKKEKEAVVKKAQKESRWKHLRNEREKLRYLYRQMISHRIRHGARIYPCHTPLEIERLEENTELEARVFDSYISYRYDERKEPSEEEILSMRE